MKKLLLIAAILGLATTASTLRRLRNSASAPATTR